nr:immunoglobulin light chain junction region [Macaca mulatta]MOW02674.1 immunoglobulin light chain junction region [Macaca mulatta]MOW03418.1 immunoglobulin light chain junction region [Macaca mulatta]MOW56555.1 immunoglobulin light chain junction region [Macaca mulatta]MOW56576.1 immunoglobulin light chain junction region [Macaca mulatta]
DYYCQSYDTTIHVF